MAARRVMVGLRAVKSVRVCFCPFETNVESTREFLHHISSKKARSSNSNCVVTTDVRHDGSEPMVDIMFADGERLIMKGANLTTPEMLFALNSRCRAKELEAEEKVKKKSA
ncbi:large ribosomal subunit protein mL53 isoform X1 [Alligator mississippiensis]|uniref:Large ribosomal subunit protein mL53 n=1 Tax=Alligator mississippiensis TaxID=8496 RepID=A0A151MN22_ALLMI|nr:large ribosomal subunit protein mL53 isoform X1 [Alligator mississippiensis]KYO25922.1 39S ribosomal protein L53, mitochondrial [Alligator mississippiensis]